MLPWSSTQIQGFAEDAQKRPRLAVAAWRATFALASVLSLGLRPVEDGPVRTSEALSLQRPVEDALEFFILSKVLLLHWL